MKPSALRKPGNPAGTAKAAAALARFANGQLGTGDYDKRVAAVLGKQPGAQQTAKRLVQALETLRCPYLSRCRRPPPWVERVWVDLDGDALAAGRRGCGSRDARGGPGRLRSRRGACGGSRDGIACLDGQFAGGL